MQEIVVRRAGVADIDEIVELLGRVADEGQWLATLSAADFRSRRARFEDALLRKDAAMFVATEAERIVGELGIMQEVRGVYGLGMAVEPDWRGRGAGSKLLAAAIEWARGTGARKIALEVFPHNAAALALYEKFGFKREGVRSQHYRRSNGDLWDSILMGLVLV